MPGAQFGQVPIMLMFGITKTGCSVCCHIHGFTPYFYMSLPNTFTESDCVPFRVKEKSYFYHLVQIYILVFYFVEKIKRSSSAKYANQKRYTRGSTYGKNSPRKIVDGLYRG